ncbi:pseudouridylate synthase 1 homolog isoform X1 [Acropora palmata]|uniref:pseudouridylate synthase 1 homolog isoform X1 n=2 Tax=Acropora palmata TaxID=6131 RepID=UPI003DA0830B
MENGDDTCKAEPDENTLSTTISPVKEDSGGLKRPLQDESLLEEETSKKKLKTEDGGERVVEVATQEKSGSLRNKKKCVLLLSYCGAGYNGMQINPGVKTIEEELINALYKAEAITEDAKACLGKMSFQRCARTDKGVSAARQVVSLKMVPDQNIVPKMNEYLPPEIRVIAMKRTTRGFDAKEHCSARTYEYVTPTYAFAKDYETTSKYRITDEKVKEVNEILSKFVGTHNYHNFTSGKKYSDPSAKRYIIKFKCGRAFEQNDREFISLSIKGQSFMLHQIRKMIGLVLAISRGIVDMNTIELARKENKVDIPRAPAIGLVLDQVHFDGYDRRYGDDGIHERLQWEDNEEEIQEFKDRFIYKHIIDTEVNDNVMYRWLRTLQEHFALNGNLKELQTKQDEVCADKQTIIDSSNSANTEESPLPKGDTDVITILEGGGSEKVDTINTEETPTPVEESVVAQVTLGGEGAKEDGVKTAENNSAGS